MSYDISLVDPVTRENADYGCSAPDARRYIRDWRD